MNIVSRLEKYENEYGLILWLEKKKLKFYCRESALPDKIRKDLVTNKPDIIEHLAHKISQPVSLTGLQEAYWLGEQDSFTQSAPAFLHLVYSGDIPARPVLEGALDKLMERHPPLRYTLNKSNPNFECCRYLKSTILERHAINGVSPTKCLSLEKSVDILPTLKEEKHLFKLILVRGEKETSLHILYRLTLFDAFSIQTFISEFIQIARGINASDLPSVSYDLKTLHKLDVDRKIAREKAKKYWERKIQSLPPGPQLPQLNGLDNRHVERRFIEHKRPLDANAYNNLKRMAKHFGVSINAVLITVYLATLSRWSEKHDISASVMYSQRRELDEAHTHCIGNYSNTLLVSYDAQPASFVEKARRTQTELYMAMQNAAFDGVYVIREWVLNNDLRKSKSAPPMPYIFSTLLGLDLRESVIVQTDHTMMTPQIWIDAQAYEYDDMLFLSWDELSNIFPEKQIEQAFDYFYEWVKALSSRDELWQQTEAPLPEPILDIIEKSNNTGVYFPEETLISGLYKQLKKDPNAIALRSSERNMSFLELASEAQQLSNYLESEFDLNTGDHVVVSGQKDRQLLTAMYSVLMAGAVYVPVSPSTPLARLESIRESADAKLLLLDETVTQSLKTGNENNNDLRASVNSGESQYKVCSYKPILANMRITANAQELTQREILPDSLAYIIFTSGTTGKPKGVSITHKAAVNTLQSCKRIFDITTDDRILSISEISFDLSVFDIFMPALSGCSVILPEPNDKPNPFLWVFAAIEHNATIWNSVPAIIEMAIITTDKNVSNLSLPESLRLFLISGDWIPLTLPSKIHYLLPTAKIVGLGGATEAAIWSNFQFVEQVPEDWTSVPYGKPLDNQKYFVLDKDLELCPPNVSGTLHIAGEGLAQGYINNRELTEKQFYFHENLNERLYNTGDMGRYNKDGIIEILGRIDNQVKINGFRVELNEIESVACELPEVQRAIVLFDRQNANSDLHLFIHCPDDLPVNQEDYKSNLFDFLKEKLSSYMLPASINIVETLPLSANGKVDIKQLKFKIDYSTTEPLSDAAGEKGTEKIVAVSSYESAIIGVVQSILPNITPMKNWFDQGCNSLQALHILQQVNQKLAQELELADIYNYPTSAQLAQALTQKWKTANRIVRFTHEKDARYSTSTVEKKPLLVFVHPVGGSTACYFEASKKLSGDYDVIGIEASLPPYQAHSIPVLAGEYFEKLKAEHLLGSKMIFAGWSLGGSIALEMAALAKRETEQITVLSVTIDSYLGDFSGKALNSNEVEKQFLREFSFIQSSNDTFNTDDNMLFQKIREDRLGIYRSLYSMLAEYEPSLITASHLSMQGQSETSFEGLIPIKEHLTKRSMLQNSYFYTIEGDHYSIMQEPFLSQWVNTMKEWITSSFIEQTTIDSHKTELDYF